MPRLAANIVIGFFIAAIGIGLWRGRIGGPASVGAADRAHIAREELMRMKMMEEVGGKELDLEFLDREFAVSAQLAWAEYDAASDQEGRAAAIDGHFQRMAHRALTRQRIYDGPRPIGLYRKIRQHLAMARLWRGLVAK